jgi:hypothetical protein
VSREQSKEQQRSKAASDTPIQANQDTADQQSSFLRQSLSELGAVQRKTSGAPSLRQQSLAEAGERRNGAPADAQQKAQAGVASSGQALPYQDTIQKAFGKHDVSNVRAHIGGVASDAADALDANAYTTGNNIAFAQQPDLHLAAHEAAHAVQQASGAVAFKGVGPSDDTHEQHAERVADAVVAGESAEPLLDQIAGGVTAASPDAVQRDAKPAKPAAARSIQAYGDPKNPAHDPGHLAESVITTLDLYEELIRDHCHPPAIYDKADAVMACRLAIRALRQGEAVELQSREQLLHRAHEQLAAADGAEALVGKAKWVSFSSAQSVDDPTQLQTDFGKWMLVASTAKPTSTDKMNCWELICFGAYQAGVISEDQLRAIYKKGVENVRNRVFRSFGPTFELATQGSTPETFVTKEDQHPLAGGAVDSPIPLRGDIVVFQSALEHACIATGRVVKNKDGDNEHEVASLWMPNGGKAERTTIETLAGAATKRPIMFWSARWDGL